LLAALNVHGGILMKYFIIYSACLALSMYFVDMESDNFLLSVVAPIGIGISILLIIVWIVLKGASSQTNTSDAAPFSSGSDCGGGDGGC
jgi:hypothetical protein